MTLNQDSKKWHVLYTKPRNEKKAAERLTAKGYQVYCPIIRTVRQWSDRKKKVQLPMFPSYIFAYTDEKERPLLLHDPGVLNFVFWLGKPAVVRDLEMEAIKKIDSGGDEIQVEGVRLEKGQLVTINEGPFKGLTGKVDKLDSHKVMVFVEQLDCMVSFRYKVTD
ncbi:MAG: UpxY family transcription antiterminator [Cyclobacteriaceae bacterium]|nr:UpxY family transcription antiterminator [Cyclobacteriaceae bacterium]